MSKERDDALEQAASAAEVALSFHSYAGTLAADAIRSLKGPSPFPVSGLCSKCGSLVSNHGDVTGAYPPPGLTLTAEQVEKVREALDFIFNDRDRFGPKGYALQIEALALLDGRKAGK